MGDEQLEHQFSTHNRKALEGQDREKIYLSQGKVL
ncbi:MAG: hypothetical protein HZLCBSQH_000470 [Candidatus Fervidibacterota bacterium]